MKEVGKAVRMSEISAYTGLPINVTLRKLRELVNSHIIIPVGDAKYGKYKLNSQQYD